MPVQNFNTIVMSATTLGNGDTVYSSILSCKYGTGYKAVLITMAGGSPSVTVTEQGSVDGTNFYDVVSGTGGALGVVATTLTTTAFIQYVSVYARFTRYKVIGAAASTVSITATMSEQS